MPLAPGTRLGPYEILAPIGAGGMGEVYRARDPRIGREVAVKVLPGESASDPERMRRFEQEARAAGGLNHPNILAIYDVGSHEKAPYVVSELLEGETLRERMGGAGLPARRAMDYGVQVALGLAAAHEKGIVHRDLKPENVFVTRDGRVKILDFGLAKLAAGGPTPEDATAALATPAPPDSKPGMVLGTVGYMSPEQVRAQAVDHRSDIFSFGTILYEMLTGKRAFRGSSAVETMSAILKEEPPELAQTSAHIPPGFDRIIRHCLEKSPDERFQSARDLAFNLQAISGLSGLSGVTPGLPALRSRARLRAALVGLALVAALAAGMLLGRRSGLVASATFQQLTFKRGAILAARFAPDGQTVVYGAAWDGRPFQLFTARPGSPESRPLDLPDASIFGISSSGEMAISLKHRFRGGFQFSGTLARTPLAGGAPREVLELVFDAAWAPDGASLAVVRSVAGRDRLEFPAGKVLAETVGWISHPRVAPGGDAVAYLDHPNWPDDAGAVAVVDLQGKKTTLSGGWYSLQGLVWSPDGREVLFTAAETGKARALYAVTPGGRRRLVTRVPGRLTIQDVSKDGRVLLTRDSVRFEIAGLAPGETKERDLSWLDGSMGQDLSLDGRTLLFSEGGEGGGAGYGVYTRGTDGSPAVRLGEGLPTTLSPDGKWVVTILRTAPPQLALVPTGPGEPRTLPRHSIKDYLWAYWLPDGKRIVINGAEEGRGLRSYIQDLESGTLRPLTPEGFWTQLVSPDGRTLAVTSGGQKMLLYPVEGGEPQPVPGAESGDRPAGWSADGRALYLFRRDELPCRVYRLDLQTGRRDAFREFLPADPSGVIATHEVQLTPDGKAYAYSYVRILSELYIAEGLR